MQQVMDIYATTPYVYLRDTDATGDALSSLFIYEDNGAVDIGWIGYSSSGHSQFNLYNTYSDGFTFSIGAFDVDHVFLDGQVGINNASPDASAALEVTSTTRGFRLTPMTADEASAITAVEGLFVFVSDTNGTFTSIGLWVYENAAWAKM